MSRRGETKKRILEAAAELFRRRGYHGTGLNQVLEESGAPRGSLYFHFSGGKQELAVSAVDASGRAIGRGIELALQSADDVGEAIGRVLDYLAADLRDSGYERGCPVGTVAMDAALPSEPVRIACAEIFAEWVTLIEGRLRAAGWEQGAARQQALLVVSSIEGGLLLARTQRDTEPLEAVGQQLRACLRPSQGSSSAIAVTDD